MEKVGVKISSDKKLAVNFHPLQKRYAPKHFYYIRDFFHWVPFLKKSPRIAFIRLRPTLFVLVKITSFFRHQSPKEIPHLLKK